MLDGGKRWLQRPPRASHGRVCRGGNVPRPRAPGGHFQARCGRGAAAVRDPAPLPPPLPPAQPPKANPSGIRGRAAVISRGHQPALGAAGRVPPCHPGTSRPSRWGCSPEEGSQLGWMSPESPQFPPKSGGQPQPDLCQLRGPWEPPSWAQSLPQGRGSAPLAPKTPPLKTHASRVQTK